MPITSTSTLRLNSTPILPRVSLSDTRVACRAKKRPGGRQYRVSRRCRRRGTDRWSATGMWPEAN